MTVDVLTQTIISKPPAVVAGFAANPDNAPVRLKRYLEG